MILGVSIGRKFDDYGFLHKQLSALGFDEIVSISNPLLVRFCKEEGKPLQEIKVFWDDIRDCDNIKTNAFGKKYNGNAMKEAMARVCDYADKIIEFGGGAYALPKNAKEKLLSQEDKEILKATKRYIW